MDDMPESLMIALGGVAMLGAFVVTIAVLETVQDATTPRPPTPDPYDPGMAAWAVLDEARRIVEETTPDGI